MAVFIAVKCFVALTLLCASLLTPGWAQDVPNDSTLNDINARPCSENQFACRNGECIPSELLCDGRADCSDQSDETQVECTKPELTCPDYTFRCAYGACVNGDATCNGIRDCIDNSDETLAKCPGVSAVDPDGSCGTEDYQCQDGQCINSTSLCDGTVDCTDGSDETFVNCGSFPCSQLVFRCNYGACIDGDLTCNNVSNCADGSDEDPQLCGRPDPGPRPGPGPFTTSQPPTPPPTPTRIPPTPRPTPTIPKYSLCLVPPQPMNGRWKVDRSLCGAISGGNVDCEFPQGVQLEPGSKIKYTCDTGYMLRGTTEVYCGIEGIWSKLPVCIEIKCGSLNSASTKAECTTRSGNYVSCEPTVLPGTRADVSCRDGYRPDSNFRVSSLECNGNGKWEPEPPKCIPVCGRINTQLSPLVVNGSPAKIGEFPWHATLYRLTNTPKGPKKEFRCGATIIQTNLLLTAAHCVWDDNIGSKEDASRYYVATGNTFREYDYRYHDPLTVRKGKVKSIHVHCNYYGLRGNYVADIAILELEQAFELSGILSPACLDLVGHSTQILEPGAVGRVAGFGRTATGPSSGNLQTLRLPYIPYNQCSTSNNAGQNIAFVSIDKFCAGYNNGSSVCEGDSGGGLVFQKGELWYVLGIVSVGLGTDIDNGERTCDRNSYSLYTRVSHHMGWIQKVAYDLEHYKSYPSCNDTATSGTNIRFGF